MVSGVMLDLEDDQTWHGKLRTFNAFCYNPVTHEVMGRSCFQWFQLICFYISFYTGLAVLFGVGLYLFLHTLDTRTPKWTVQSSLMGAVPGMGFRPKISENSTSLLWVNGTASSDYSGEQVYIDLMAGFLAPYQDANQINASFVDCSLNNQSANGTNVCRVKMSSLGPCGADPTYGYSPKTPCVAVKLNRMIGWTPQPYTNLAEVHVNVTNFYSNMLGQPLTTVDPNAVYVTCDGAQPPDVEHMGPITLHPKTIAAYYFPYTNAPGYLSPIIMVQFLNPTNGVVIHVVCSTFAQNLVPDQSNVLATVSFQLLVSSPWDSYF